MKKLVTLPMLAVLSLPGIAFSEAPPRPQDGGCSTYFGVLQDDPKAPGRFVARMTSSQAKWYAKNGRQQYLGLCLALEKARYLIVWTASERTRTIQTTQTRTTQVNTTTTGQESGTFSTYGSLSRWGRYSGTSSGSSTGTVTYQESVPVSVTAQYCAIYVLRSVGPTIWDDIRNKTPQPPVIFSTETRGPSRVDGSAGGTDGVILGLGSVISLAARREPTRHALDAALGFISIQPPSPPAQPVVPAQQAATAPIASPADSPVSVKSNPDGADITVDGRYVGSTPSVIRLTAGDREIEVAKSGFKPWKRKMTVSAGGQVTIDATLEKETPQ